MLQISNVYNIAGVFFNEPTKPHYLIEISRKSELAHTSVKKYLDDLKKDRLIKESIEKKGKRHFPIYIADIKSPSYKKHKKMYNIMSIKKSGVIEFLKDKLMPKSIVLFGSYANGDDIEDSDIDIFAEAKKQNVDLNKFERILKRKIEIHFNENFNNYPKELKNNIINGDILYGYLEAFK